MDLQGAPYGYTPYVIQSFALLCSQVSCTVNNTIAPPPFTECAPPENQRLDTSFGDLAFGRIISAIDRITSRHSMWLI